MISNEQVVSLVQELLSSFVGAPNTYETPGNIEKTVNRYLSALVQDELIKSGSVKVKKERSNYLVSCEIQSFAPVNFIQLDFDLPLDIDPLTEQDLNPEEYFFHDAC